MDDIKIELATRVDLPKILALQKEAYVSEAEIYDDFSIQPLRQSLAEIETDFEKQLFLKAENGGHIVGSVRALEKDGVCCIGRLIVKPSRQNQGMGSMLLTTMESRFPEANRFELFTGHKSRKNLHLYRKHGYETFRRQKVSHSLTLVYLYKNASVPIIR